MWQYLLAIVGVPLLLLLWLVVQQLGRRSARAHPELGPYREEGGGCGKNCGCHGGHCRQRPQHDHP